MSNDRINFTFQTSLRIMITTYLNNENHGKSNILIDRYLCIYGDFQGVQMYRTRIMYKSMRDRLKKSRKFDAS